MEGVGEETSFLDALVGQALVDSADERFYGDKLFPAAVGHGGSGAHCRGAAGWTV